MRFQFNRSSKEPMSEINVTPFVDVMLVLLIFFNFRQKKRSEGPIFFLDPKNAKSGKNGEFLGVLKTPNPAKSNKIVGS